MSTFTPEQQDRLNALRAQFDDFVDTNQRLLRELFEQIGATDIENLHRQPSAYVDTLDRWLGEQDLAAMDDDDRVWLAGRVGSLVGDVLIERFAGRWMVCDRAESPNFLRYVVGDFKSGPGSSGGALTGASTAMLTIDPFDRVRGLADGQALSVAEVIGELAMAVQTGQ
ncbi:MAG: hypothetical protein AAGC55_26180 [Myxococcota bacterium]